VTHANARTTVYARRLIVERRDPVGRLPASPNSSGSRGPRCTSGYAATGWKDGPGRPIAPRDRCDPRREPRSRWRPGSWRCDVDDDSDAIGIGRTTTRCWFAIGGLILEGVSRAPRWQRCPVLNSPSEHLAPGLRFVATLRG
jgi:hypothetical protein